MPQSGILYIGRLGVEKLKMFGHICESLDEIWCEMYKFHRLRGVVYIDAY